MGTDKRRRGRMVNRWRRGGEGEEKER